MIGRTRLSGWCGDVQLFTSSDNLESDSWLDVGVFGDLSDTVDRLIVHGQDEVTSFKIGTAFSRNRTWNSTDS
ncbi:hypothetical protein WICPIJ_002689 [Wickerhamomyces pijperi]|uniref:Uncharacterized protein n=1 Tax=Wickerhamomyces pijperi TaxID=599730 RepID=A0A9P8Q8H7_WICPI|nr:hypothetical protein WICPIJ_002689 [Wickerhamomyces pijperi]